MPEHQRERDLVLAPNEFAFISDQTKGNINVYVGPYKTSLANTDQPVMFNERTKVFENCSLEQSTNVFATAPEGWYVVMKNPAEEPKNQHPTNGTSNSLIDLQVGHKVNIAGPKSFALWPGQMVRIIKGHHLRSNQFLTVRVYDEDSAHESWDQAVIKMQDGGGEGGGEVPERPELTMGKQLVIRGNDVSFYIPPTGIEVVRDDRGNYVRHAVTLERLEYCILLDENGNKRFIRGPAVVFPEPTETFVVRNGRRKFKAIELNELSGIYIKVIAPYTDAEGNEHEVGEELFITGKEQMIYFPRPEHAIIKYGDREIHYAVAIPAGEGRYCLDRNTGKIRLVEGPTMFLADPRHEVIVRRVLEPKHVAMWFPGNEEALEYNRNLKRVLEEKEGEYVTDKEVARARKKKPVSAPAEGEAGAGFAGDGFQRRSNFTPPRTITLDTKYEGAVNISPYTGYAVQVVSRTGERKVIVGPTSYLLKYDEILEAMGLSTGTPKSDEKLLKTAYLRVLYNKVSDLVLAESQDLCQVRLHLSYRVNFEGDPNQWFNVENYVKFLTDHMRSLLRNAVKGYGVEQFYAEAIHIVRDTILGMPDESGKRPGRAFEENGMRIYDVEVLDVRLGDKTIEAMLINAQQAVINQTLELQSEKRKLEFVEASEDIKRQIADTEAQTRLRQLDLKITETNKQLESRLADIEAKASAQQHELSNQLAEQDNRDAIHTARLGRERLSSEQQLELEKERIANQLEQLRAEVDAVVNKAEAVSPDLVAALQAFSDRAMVERVASSMAPLAILGGNSVADVLGNLLRGTALENVTQVVAQLHDAKSASQPDVIDAEQVD